MLAAMPVKKRAFISYDYDHDDDLKKLLVGQSLHPDSPFEFKDNSVKDHLPGDWQDKVRRRMDNIDVVIVLCGELTYTATGVAVELRIAVEKGKPWFLLRGRAPPVVCTRPSNVAPGEKMYNWTWDNLRALIGGAR
jgi:hypothetical protein